MKRESISRRVTVTMSVLLLTAAIVTTVVSIWNQYRVARQILHRDRETVEQNITPVLSYLLWVLNEEQANQVAQGLLDKTGIVRVRVVLHDEAILLDLADDTERPASLTPEVVHHPLVYTRGDETILVGTLHVAFLHPWRYVLENAPFITEVLIDLLITGVFIVLVVISVRFLVTAPLHRLARDIGSVDFTRSLPDWWDQEETQDGNGETRMVRHVMGDASRRIQVEIRERLKTEQDLAASLEQKNVLLREVHHRVKNNLQLVISLIALQRNSLEDPEARDALVDSENRILSMALVHELLYREQQYAAINLGNYLRDLSRGVAMAGIGESRKIELEHRFAEVTVELETAIPIGLIVNELLTNAVKHAFHGRNEGTITIGTDRDDEEKQIKLSISDDGRGLPPDWEQRRTKSLGLLIVDTLCAQLEATLSCASDTSGTRFTLTIPRRAVNE